MIIPLTHIADSMMTYKYLVLIPLSILEGPIVAVIAGFLTTLHIMNVFIVYIILIIGDITGDALLYMFGRYGGTFFRKYSVRIGVTSEKLESAKNYFNTHHTKALVTSKLFFGIGVSGLAAAGILKIPYLRFMRTCVVISIIQSALFILIGIMFGHAYEQIGNYYNTYAAAISVTTLIIIVFFIFLKIKKTSNTITNI